MANRFTLTVQQRLNIEGIIRQQRSPDDETLMLNYDLLKKIRIGTEERPLYMREVTTPQGTMSEFNNRNIQAAPSVEVNLEAPEIRRLETLLREWKQYSTDDIEWLSGLKRQIGAVNNGVAAMPRLDGPVKPEKTSRQLKEQ